MSGKYRMRYVIKCKLNGRTKKMFSLLLDEFSGKVGKKMSVGIDINPNTI